MGTPVPAGGQCLVAKDEGTTADSQKVVVLWFFFVLFFNENSLPGQRVHCAAPLAN